MVSHPLGEKLSIPDLYFIGWDQWVKQYGLPELWKNCFPETISDSIMVIVEAPTDNVDHFVYETEDKFQRKVTLSGGVA